MYICIASNRPLVKRKIIKKCQLVTATEVSPKESFLCQSKLKFTFYFTKSPIRSQTRRLKTSSSPLTYAKSRTVWLTSIGTMGRPLLSSSQSILGRVSITKA